MNATVNINESASITDLIAEARRGDAQALDGIFRLAYDDLHALASARLRASDGDGLLDSAALVNESYLRFVQTGNLKAEDRPYFLNYAGRVMRSVVVDFARERLAERRDGEALHVTLHTDAAEGMGRAHEQEILRVHESLEELAKRDDRLASVVEMRYFGGLSEAEIAASLDVDPLTVRRDWETARPLLAEALRSH
jgi:RNA polymerase sigma factor (TIGR02999 family)